MDARIVVCAPGSAFVLGLPDGLRLEDVPATFLGVLDHIDDEGNLHVIVSGWVPNDFSQAVFRKVVLKGNPE